MLILDYFSIGFWILIGTLILAIVGHPLWLLYAFLLRKVIKISKQSKANITDESKHTTIKKLPIEFYTYILSGEGLQYLTYLGSVLFVLALILLLKDFIAQLLTLRYIQLIVLILFTFLAYLMGWKLLTWQNNPVLAKVLLMIGAILFPVNFWYYHVYILMVENRNHYIVGFLCTALYFLTAVRLSSVIFSYIALFTFHTSLLLILYRLNYPLEKFVFTSALIAVFYPFIAGYLENRNKPFFKYPLIIISLGGLFFSIWGILALEQLKNIYLSLYLSLCGIIILNKITQIQVDYRYPFLGIPIVIPIYIKHLAEFDLTHYWIGILFSSLSAVMLGILLILERRDFRSLSDFGDLAPFRPLSLNLKDHLFFLTLTLIIFSLTIDLTSYIYLVSKLMSLKDLGHLYTQTAFSFDLLGESWKGLQISIYYLSHFSFVSLVILFSTLFTTLIAVILAGLAHLRILGFYGALAFLGCFTIALARFWHPLLYGNYYFLFYFGLALLSFFLIIGPVQNSRQMQQVFTPPLYILAGTSLLISYMLAGLYFDLTRDKNFDYYLCTLSLLGGIILLLAYRIKSTASPQLKLSGALLMITPLCISSFVEWTSYIFFIFATLTTALGYLIYGWTRQERTLVSIGIFFLMSQIVYILITIQPGQVLVKLILLTLGVILILAGIYLKKWNMRR